MGFIDIVLIVIIGAFVFFGFFFGLFHTLGSVIGTIVGIIFASRLIDPAFSTFGFLFGGGTTAKIILFIFIFFLITRAVGLVFWFLSKFFHFFSWIPFLRSFDRMLGGFFGFIEGIIVVGVVLFYAMQILPDDTLRDVLETSRVADFLIVTMTTLQIFFPEYARQAVESAADSTARTIPPPVTTAP